MNLQTAEAENKNYVMNTYGRMPVVPVKGEGCWIWDSEGNKYLDFVAGIAVNSLGQCHPAVTGAICRQAEQLMHCSNLYLLEQQIKLAKVLTDNSCCDKVFFCNSGAEANEAAIKLVRKYSSDKFGPGRYEIITAVHSFHGRTLAAITATGQPKYQKGFEPLPEGFTYVEYNDLAALADAVSSRTCAVMLEAVQGEGGVWPAEKEYLHGVYQFCREHDLLLIIDEVQTGIGRTGKLFAYQHYDIKPDIITLAKALGNGVPIGAMMAQDSVADAFQPGNHASTFGGNPLSCAAALAVMDVMLSEDVPAKAAANGAYLQQVLGKLKEKHGEIVEIRGKGLLVGMQLSREVGSIVRQCMKNGLLILSAGPNVLRFIPSLLVSKEEIDLAAAIVDQSIAETRDGI